MDKRACAPFEVQGAAWVSRRRSVEGRFSVGKSPSIKLSLNNTLPGAVAIGSRSILISAVSSDGQRRFQASSGLLFARFGHEANCLCL